MLLVESWPLLLSGISIMVYMKIDQIMLGQILGDESVGIYSAALRISEIWYFIPMISSLPMMDCCIWYPYLSLGCLHLCLASGL